MARGFTALYLLLLLFASSTLYTIGDPSHDSFIEPGPISGEVYKELWGFDWGSGLDIQVLSREEIEYNGTTVTRTHITFSLYPWSSDCRIHGYVYSTGSSSYWVILVHGLGGSHEFFEEELDGYRIPYELALMGYNVLSIDAAGHGDSCIPGGETWKDLALTLEPGEFFLYHVYASGLRAVEAAKSLGAEPGRIVFSGVSMGGLATLAVAAIHPDVTMGIPIVASGCLTCMIQSGGLANLVGPADATLNSETVSMLAASDPLAYIKWASGKGLLEGKVFYMPFSGHDEYFPVEGLEATVRELRNGGARVYVAFDGNNNHYRPAPGWIRSILDVAEAFKNGGVEEVARVLESGASPGIREWRPASDGLMYIPPLPLLPRVVGEQVDTVKDSPMVTSLPSSSPYTGRLLVLALVTGILVVLGVWYGGCRSRYYVSLLLGYLAAVLYVLPFWSWPGRFSLSLLSVMERFGVTPSMAMGVPSLQVLTLAVIISPLMVASAVLAGRKRLGVVASILYTLVSLAPFILMRIVIGLIRENALQATPDTVIPLEVVVIVLAAVAIYTGRRIGDC